MSNDALFSFSLFLTERGNSIEPKQNTNEGIKKINELYTDNKEPISFLTKRISGVCGNLSGCIPIHNWKRILRVYTKWYGGLFRVKSIIKINFRALISNAQNDFVFLLFGGMFCPFSVCYLIWVCLDGWGCSLNWDVSSFFFVWDGLENRSWFQLPFFFSVCLCCEVTKKSSNYLERI